jgi:uncharacterized protein (DUF1330 family)
MSAYLLINAKILDREKFAAYGKVTAEIVARMGGQYLVLGGPRELLEGTWPEGKSVVSIWPSREAALAFWNSPEYAEAKKLREGICVADVVLVDGLPTAPGTALPWKQQ